MSSSLLFGVATGPDLLRLLAVPVFAWAAYRDLRTRRVPNWTWYPLVVVGLVALLWDVLALGSLAGVQRRLFVVQTVLSLGSRETLDSVVADVQQRVGQLAERS